MTQRILEERPASSPSGSKDDEVKPSVGYVPPRVFSTGLGLSLQPGAYGGGGGETAGDDDEDARKHFYTIIKADLLIPGDGEPATNSALVIEDKVIAWVGPTHEIPSEYTGASHREYSVPYLMPGLWDCHTHFGGEGEEDGEGYLGFVTVHPAAAGARLARGLWETLQRGYTSVRDLAGFGCEVAKAIDEGTIVGPNVYASGACLSQTAGHGDVFVLPVGDAVLNLGVGSPHAGHYSSGMSNLVDGVDECRKAVRMNIRRGAKVIKLFATGGVMSRDDNPLNAQFSAEELDVIIQEATRQRLLVAAHAHAKDGILAAAKAGVGTLEHGSFADQECFDLIKKKGIVYIATRNAFEYFLQTDGKGLPKKLWDKLKLCAASHLVAYKLAIQSGVTIALGTDTPPGFNMAVELEYAVAAGLSNLEAIKAATANGPLSVGIQAPKTGQLKAGYDADIIGITHNPVRDVKVLQQQENIKWVWKGGKLFKGPGVGPWGEE